MKLNIPNNYPAMSVKVWIRSEAAAVISLRAESMASAEMD